VPDRRLLGVVLVIALMCRVIPWLAAAADPARVLSPPDSAEYVAIGHNVAAGHGFSADPAPPYRPDLRRTPTYPSLLAGAFLMPNGGLRLASLLGVLAGAASVAATCWIAARLFGRSAALIGGLLLAFDLTSISYSVVIMTEALFTLLLVAGVIVLMKRPSGSGVSIRGGLLLGCATLCRPAGLLLAPVSLPVCAWQQSGAGRIARDYLRVNAVFLVVLLLWIGRNFVVAGTPTLSSIWSVNLYFHRAAAVEARLEGRTVNEVRDRSERRFQSLSRSLSEADKLEWMTGHAREVIAAHPWTYVLITVDGFVYMMESDTSELRRLFGLHEGSAALRAIDVSASVQLWILYPAAAIGLLAAWRDPDRRRAALIPVAFIAYFVFVSGPEAYARFRVPVMPFLAILGGLGIEQVVVWIRERVNSAKRLALERGDI
jgi:4-amino-4-deoxy-L-arabinose transferase-like glycosyltransferase